MVYATVIPLFTVSHNYLIVTNWCRIYSICSIEAHSIIILIHHEPSVGLSCDHPALVWWSQQLLLWFADRIKYASYRHRQARLQFSQRCSFIPIFPKFGVEVNTVCFFTAKACIDKNVKSQKYEKMRSQVKSWECQLVPVACKGWAADPSLQITRAKKMMASHSRELLLHHLLVDGFSSNKGHMIWDTPAGIHNCTLGWRVRNTCNLKPPSTLH